MKFSTAALFVASASAISLPAQDNQYGAQQSPDTDTNWGRGGSSDWAGFPQPVQSNPYSSFNPYPAQNPYPPQNPYPSYPQPPPYPQDPYSQPSPYVQPNPYVAPPPPQFAPPPPAYATPEYGPDVNAPLTGIGADQAPQQVTIEKTGYSGNGCPAGSVSTVLSPDKTIVTFGFDSFQAVQGNGANPADKQKNCQLHLGLRYPGGYQLSIAQATYHGYVRLDPGVTANFISSYYFSQAAEKTALTRTTLSGPEYLNGKTYTKADSIQNESMIWGPCGANGILNINNRIALTGPANRAGEISNDDATIKFEQKLRIQWRRCPGGRRLDVDTTETPAVEQRVTDSNMVVN